MLYCVTQFNRKREIGGIIDSCGNERETKKKKTKKINPGYNISMDMGDIGMNGREL